ncbi:hypothetical protein F5148DRAFT_1284263 [Russula earlei]|uniref:Uncharacterized protein n=1 Tax=Russula earlei TaxID=71964 RepID=A0ACC0U9F7_9AGAM|nr:hypothetical protein F5148DRAFT_1284263 [Russula earlei]
MQVERQIPLQLFHRIVASAKRKQHYSYRLSFQDEVGSSLDPDMEDITEWERFLSEGGPLPPGEPDPPLSEFDEEEIAELAAQAEEAELWGDLDADRTIFDLSDINDTNVKPQAFPDDDNFYPDPMTGAIPKGPVYEQEGINSSVLWCTEQCRFEVCTYQHVV